MSFDESVTRLVVPEGVARLPGTEYPLLWPTRFAEADTSPAAILINEHDAGARKRLFY